MGGLGFVLVAYAVRLSKGLLLDGGGVLLGSLLHALGTTVFQCLGHLLAETVLLHVFLVVSAALRSHSHVAVEATLVTHCAVAHDVSSVFARTKLVA